MIAAGSSVNSSTHPDAPASGFFLGSSQSYNSGMVALNDRERRVVEGYHALPSDRRPVVLAALLEGERGAWRAYQTQGSARMAALAAERGLDWHAMSDESKQQFVCDLLDEK